MKIKWHILNRKVHYWGAIICALPVIIIICTGMLLVFKKQSSWIQPLSQKGQATVPTISYHELLEVVKSHPDVGIISWEDIERLDVRPSKGIIKVRGKNKIEIQVDHTTGEILQIAKRRSDVIEAIHDGSFFHEYVKFGIFFPSAIILLILWITGIYLFLLPYLRKRKKR